METDNAPDVVTATFKLPAGLHKSLQKAAKTRGMSFSRLVREAIDIYTHLDESVRPQIQDMADTYGLPEWKILRNIVLKHIGEAQAWEAFGYADLIAVEFSRTRKGDTLNGDELIAEAKKFYTSIFNLLKTGQEAVESAKKVQDAMEVERDRIIEDLAKKQELLEKETKDMQERIAKLAKKVS